MKKYVVILFCLVAFLGCDNKLQPKKPDNLLSKAEMTDILQDLFIVSSAKGVNRTKFEKIALNPEAYILKKHNIDSTQFAQNNDYYAHDIKVYKSIIEDIKKRLTAKKEKFTAQLKAEKADAKRMKDSIKKAQQINKIEQATQSNSPSRVKIKD